MSNENKDMENLKANEMENASGGELPTFQKKDQITCPKCGSHDVRHIGLTFHCQLCGHNWREIIR